MAITKLLNIKASKVGRPSTGLKNCIEYILNPEKTNDIWIGGNSGSNAEEVYQAMMETKMDYEKMEGRQGYHMILSFKPGETDEKTAYLITKEFCEKYFRDNYDHVFAIHTDKAHLHGHIVFNSVGRIDGLKYHYVKGDWEKNIQPIANELCRKYGLSELRFEKGKRKGKSREEYESERKQKLTWKDFLKVDIDQSIALAKTYEDFLKTMRTKYQIREGKSRNRESYITVQWGNERGERKRIYEKYDGKKNPLGIGYSLSEIKQRIENREIKKIETVLPFQPPPRVKNMSCMIRLTVHRTYYSRYQKAYVTRLWRVQNIRSPYEVSDWAVRKDIMRIDQLLGDIQFLIGNNIRSEEELKNYHFRLKYSINEMQREKYKGLDKFTAQERRVIEKYKKLVGQMDLEQPGSEEYENCEDELEDLEMVFPAETLVKEYDTIQKQAKILEKQIRILRKENRQVERLLESNPQQVILRKRRRKKVEKKAWKKENTLLKR